MNDTMKAVEIAAKLGIKTEPIRGGYMTKPVKVEDSVVRDELQKAGFDVNPITWMVSFRSKEE